MQTNRDNFGRWEKKTQQGWQCQLWDSFIAMHHQKKQCIGLGSEGGGDCPSKRVRNLRFLLHPFDRDELTNTLVHYNSFKHHSALQFKFRPEPSTQQSMWRIACLMRQTVFEQVRRIRNRNMSGMGTRHYRKYCNAMFRQPSKRRRQANSFPPFGNEWILDSTVLHTFDTLVFPDSIKNHLQHA